jgi:hypothetical protein
MSRAGLQTTPVVVARIAGIVTGQCGVSEIREQCGATCSRLARSRDEAYGVIRRGAATPPDANRAAAMEANF